MSKCWIGFYYWTHEKWLLLIRLGLKIKSQRDCLLKMNKSDYKSAWKVKGSALMKLNTGEMFLLNLIQFLKNAFFFFFGKTVGLCSVLMYRWRCLVKDDILKASNSLFVIDDPLLIGRSVKAAKNKAPWWAPLALHLLLSKLKHPTGETHKHTTWNKHIRWFTLSLDLLKALTTTQTNRCPQKKKKKIVTKFLFFTPCLTHNAFLTSD